MGGEFTYSQNDTIGFDPQPLLKGRGGQKSRQTSLAYRSNGLPKKCKDHKVGELSNRDDERNTSGKPACKREKYQKGQFRLAMFLGPALRTPTAQQKTPRK